MRIRSKLSWTFTLLIVLGVTSISSYSIWFIREFLVAEGRDRLVQDARLYANVARYGVANVPQPTDSTAWLGLYDDLGRPLALLSRRRRQVIPPKLPANPYFSGVLQASSWHVGEDLSRDQIWVVHQVPGPGPVRYLVLNRRRSELYAPIRVIRWIIYTGMVISILTVVLVSRIFARNLTRPVQQLTSAAQRIASGDTDARLGLRRKDEFGELATSLNQMANILRQDNQRLQTLYHELQEAQVRQAQFYSDITHEIRNPLQALGASLELLALPDVPLAQQQNYLRQAQIQTERLTRLFNDLMTLQRSDADPHFVRLQPVELADAVARAIEPYREAATRKGLTVAVDVPAVRVAADPRRLEQVLDNLMSNAVKYTAQGHIQVQAIVQGSEVQVCVRDTGAGIAASDIPKLTNRFYRTDKARQRDADPDSLGGTGLGLAVVERILAAHGSRLAIESTLGVGSAFSFQLPVA